MNAGIPASSLSQRDPMQASLFMRRLRILRSDRVLVIAPHPDDESLAAGGLIQEAVRTSASLRVLFATDGENNPWPQRVALRRWHIGQREQLQWAARRRKEAIAALAILGLGANRVTFLHYPDQGLTDLIVGGDTSLASDLEAQIRGFRPTLVIGPSQYDLHPDHNTLGRLIQIVLQRVGRPDMADLSYVIHGAERLITDGDGWCLPLRERQLHIKRQAVLAHASQMMLSRRRFLRYAEGDEIFHRDGAYAAPDAGSGVAVERPEARRIGIRFAHSPPSTTRLYLLAAREQAYRLRVAPHFRAPAQLRGLGATGLPVETDRARSALRLTLPESVVQGDIWFKAERDWRFLDLCGWQRLPSPSRRAPSPPVCCVIPCYNIASLCGPVVQAAARHADHVIAIDDGSSDSTRQALYAAAACDSRIHVLSRTRNAGKGLALLAGFRYAALNLDAGVIVTMDGDNQHRPEDIPRLVAASHSTGAALVIGERTDFHLMPVRSRIGNEITSALVHLLYRKAPRDTQSGFRALSREFALRCLCQARGRRYETELEMLLDALSHHLGVAGVPIPTIYHEGNRSSHFRPLRDSIRVLSTLARCRFGTWSEDQAQGSWLARLVGYRGMASRPKAETRREKHEAQLRG